MPCILLSNIFVLRFVRLRCQCKPLVDAATHRLYDKLNQVVAIELVVRQLSRA